MSKDTGGPAFQATEQHGLNNGDSGMTLRDYFAAKAMAIYAGDFADFETAKFSYEMADAMLAERAK